MKINDVYLRDSNYMSRTEEKKSKTVMNWSLVLGRVLVIWKLINKNSDSSEEGVPLKNHPLLLKDYYPLILEDWRKVECSISGWSPHLLNITYKKNMIESVSITSVLIKHPWKHITYSKRTLKKGWLDI